MALCSCLSFFVLWQSHTLFGTWVYHHGTMCHVHLWPWPLTSISILYFHHEFESGKISSLFDIGIPNFGISVYHHEITCWVHSWPKYDLDLWPICSWQGVSLASFTHSFYLDASVFQSKTVNLLFNSQNFLTEPI